MDELLNLKQNVDSMSKTPTFGIWDHISYDICVKISVSETVDKRIHAAEYCSV